MSGYPQLPILVQGGASATWTAQFRLADLEKLYSTRREQARIAAWGVDRTEDLAADEREASRWLAKPGLFPSILRFLNAFAPGGVRVRILVVTRRDGEIVSGETRISATSVAEQLRAALAR
jgi:hypothetical protein